jgi:hypothetical protein
MGNNCNSSLDKNMKSILSDLSHIIYENRFFPKHPTYINTKLFNDSFRPLLNARTSHITITSNFNLVKQLYKRLRINIRQETVLYFIDVTYLYTVMSQIDGRVSLKKMMTHLKPNITK